MKNTYATSHFPLLSIILFGLSSALSAEIMLIAFLAKVGIYEGMLEFVSENGIKLALLFLLWLTFFMVLAALKLIADTMIGFSLLFFSKDLDWNVIGKVKTLSWIYLAGSAISLFFIFSFQIIIGIFILTTLIYFVYFVYKVSEALTLPRTLGIVFMNITFWFAFVFIILFTALKLYNSFLSSLPI